MRLLEGVNMVKKHVVRLAIILFVLLVLCPFTATPTEAVTYTIINSVTALQGMKDDLSANYRLGHDISASATSSWNGGLGFEPVGSSSTPYTGIFDGNGYEIDELFTARPSASYVGLFGYTEGATIQDVGLVDADISGGGLCIGSLIGTARDTTVTNCYATGLTYDSSTGTPAYSGGLIGYLWPDEIAVSVTGCYVEGDVTGKSDAAGLIGTVDALQDTTISSCYTSGTVTNTAVSGNVGGLIALANSGSSADLEITFCYSTMTITKLDSYNGCGGLIGQTGVYSTSTFTIEDCYATGSVTASNTPAVGGLIGNDGSTTVIDCYATGAAIGDNEVGGLIGAKYNGSITDGYATGAATAGDDYAGGLIGFSDNVDLLDCCATGDATATGNYAGGLAGWIYDSGDKNTVSICYALGDASADDYAAGFVSGTSTAISNCYARGDCTVTSVSDPTIGGFVGDNYWTIDDCYSTGDVTSPSSIYDGGFCGYNDDTDGIITDCFWDKQTSGYTTSDGGSGRTTAEMKTEATFTDHEWDFTTIWTIDADGILNGGYAYFGLGLGLPPPSPDDPDGPPALSPAIPTYLLAAPLSQSEISLTWDKGANPQVGIYYKVDGYPSDRSDGTLVYRGSSEIAAHSGLEAGTTYYYRAWGYDTATETWSTNYDQDFATTFMGEAAPEAPTMPSEWFQTPQCTAYTYLPLIFPALDGVATEYEIPVNNMCVGFTLFWIVAVSLASYMVTKQLLLPIIVSSVLIAICSIAVLLPMWMLMITVALGGLALLLWRRI